MSKEHGYGIIIYKRENHYNTKRASTDNFLNSFVIRNHDYNKVTFMQLFYLWYVPR